jgi:hypothetical protein
MKLREKLGSVKQLVMAGLVSVGAMAAPAFAQGTTGSLSGLSTIFSNLDQGDIIASFIAGGVVIAAVGFAKWGTKKAAKFFG